MKQILNYIPIADTIAKNGNIEFEDEQNTDSFISIIKM
jgi:hypothetical protein